MASYSPWGRRESDMTESTEHAHVQKGTNESLDENEKAGLKFNIMKTKIMTSGPITSWQIEGEVVEAMTDFIFMGSIYYFINHYGECSHEIKRHLLLGRKAMTNLDNLSRFTN